MSFFRSIRFWIGVLISAVCLWLAFRNVPFAEFIDKLSTARLGYIALAVVFQLLAILARGKRWQMILGKQVSFMTAALGHGVGFLFNNILPFRAGELARTVAVAEQAKLPFLRVGSTVLIERLIDVAVVVLGLILVLPFMQVSSEVIQGGLLLGSVAFSGLLLLFIGAMRPAWGRQVVAFIIGRVPRISVERGLQWFDQVIHGLEALTTFKQAGLVFLWSIISWLCSIQLYWLVFLAFQPQARWLEATFVVVAISLSISIPSSPGFLGVFQYIGQQALVIPFGAKYDAATALAAIMVAYMIYYLGTSLFGVVALIKGGQSIISFGERVFNRSNVS